MIPIYMINGFLDSGKTEFIQYTLSQPYFQSKAKTLLLVCEEGEIEYDEEILSRSNTAVEVLEDESEFTSQNLIRLEKKHRPARIIIEYNGMWNSKSLKTPWHWKIEQQITCVDGTTFATYFANMKSMMADMMRKSELIIVNRCDGLLSELAAYKRGIKAINQKAEIIFEDKNGEVNATLEEDLPFDVNSDVIKLDDEGYAVWYLDAFDNMERYRGKIVEYTAMVLHPQKFPQGYFVPGRMVMTCCEDDVAFLGYACKYAGEKNLAQKEWIKVRAKINVEYFADYGKEGPVLEAISVEKTKAPKESVISFM